MLQNFFFFQELKADKEVLQKQVFDQLNHISTLKLQVEDLKFNSDVAESEAVKELRHLLAAEREALETKDKEMRCVFISSLFYK